MTMSCSSPTMPAQKPPASMRSAGRRPRRMLDLFAEFRALTNGGGNQHGNGLIGALLHFGLPTIGAEEKEAMRDLAMRGGPWTAEETAATSRLLRERR